MSGKLIKKNDKVIYVFGVAEVPGYVGYMEESHIGINLDTGKVDEIKNNYADTVYFTDLTDSQQLVLAEAIPLRQHLAKKALTVSAAARSGKDTLAEMVTSKFAGVSVIAMADPIRAIDRVISGVVEGKNRESLIMIGQGLRKEDANIWLKVWLRNAIEIVRDDWEHKKSASKFICQDVRQPNEKTFFQSLGALSIKIVADEEKRVAKIIELDGNADMKLMKDETESHVGGFTSDIEVNNDYTPMFASEVEDKVITALKVRGW
jgi:hypothetical protein